MISHRQADLIEKLTPMKEIEFYFSSWAGSGSKLQSSYCPHPETFKHKDAAFLSEILNKLNEVPGTYEAQGKTVIGVGIESVGSIVENIAKQIPGYKGSKTVQDTKFEYRVKVWFK